MKKRNRVIITDIDGVVLNWEDAFITWMEHQGHKRVEGSQFVYNAGVQFGMSREEGHRMVEIFNQSAVIGFLPPLRDAQHYIKRLAEEHGYRFIALTSLSTDKYAKALRQKNLEKLFGEIWDDVICLPTGADKDESLTLLSHIHPGSYWIEDKVQNVESGLKVGFPGILMEHGYNMDARDDDKFFTATNWEEIYNYVTQ
jgi:hypothetical protein|tara:strand:+ start:872 stop:1468 length:597 start_codon:yes stop_codon:yes gene_type:complete